MLAGGAILGLKAGPLSAMADGELVKIGRASCRERV